MPRHLLRGTDLQLRNAKTWAHGVIGAALSLDHPRYAVDLVPAVVNAAFGVMENSVFVEKIIDCCASAHGINLTEYMVETAKQQGRCTAGHGFSPTGVGRGLRRLDVGQFRWGRS